MDILRAPWRMEYINSSNTTEVESGRDNEEKEISQYRCLFCDFAKDDNDKENLIIERGGSSYVIMNRYPYSVGHLLIVPFRHTAIFPSLSDNEKNEIFSLAQKSISVLQKILNTDGFNIGMNIGKIAGAGIDAHLHLHIVPRWSGDVNFMSVTAETKILPEALLITHGKIIDEWKI